jgi:hypothetical protein
MGVFVSKDKNPYNRLRDIALLQNAKDIDALPVDEDEPYKVLIEFYVSGTPVSVFCAIDGTASIYLGTGSGFINGGMENETIRQIAKSIVFESKNIIGSLETMKVFPVVQDGWVNVFVVTDRNIYGTSVNQGSAVGRGSDIWEIYCLAIEIISMYMNS